MKSFYNIKELAYALGTNKSRLYKARAADSKDIFKTRYVALSPRNTLYPCDAVIETLVRLGKSTDETIQILNSLDSEFMKNKVASI